jgi:PPOX class probable F420-dependent enzyme
MRSNLDIVDLGDFVELPLVAVLATYRRDGTVLLSPVWHEWRDGGFNVITDFGGIKAQHLRRDPRASIVVADQSQPYRGIELRGEAELTTEGFHEAIRRIAVRYLGNPDGLAYAESGGDNLLIRLEPGHLRVWDFADES